jgi:outer membrane protein assembly factor BamB
MFSTFVLAFSLSAAPTANWPQFRGPTGDGVAPAGAKVPTVWSESENIRWKTPIHDKGWSSPVVWGDRIWLTTAKADGKEFFALCIDKNTGKILHDISLLKVANPAFCHPFNSYASCTPCIEEGRVYIHFGSYGTFCLDSETGKTLWENKDYKCDHYRGPGSSPILFENLLILTFDGFDLKYQVALDKATGKQVWKQDHNIKYSTANGDYHKAYGTPSVLTVKGEPQLVVPAAEATIAYNPRTGQELWRVHTGGMNQSIRPVLAHDLIYISAGHEQKLFAVKAGQSGTIPAAGIAWKAMKEAPTRPSFLVLGDYLYMVNDKAIATCLEAKSGKPVWRERLDGEFSSSPVAVGNLIIISNEANRSGEEGKTFVFEAANTYKPVSVNKLAAGVMASPAVIEDGLILRTKTHLYRIGAK